MGPYLRKRDSVMWIFSRLRANLLRPLRGLETIFIRGGAPMQHMKDFHENAGLGSHADRDVCGKRGLLGSTKNPRLT